MSAAVEFFNDYQALTTAQKDAVVLLLAQEFFAFKDVGAGERLFRENFDTGKEQVLTITTDGTPIGAFTYKSYLFGAIAPQLFVEGGHIDGDSNKGLERVRFRKFSDLLQQTSLTGNYQIVLELAYAAILEEYRGRGMSSQAAFLVIKHLATQYENGITFGIARGIYAQSDIHHKMKDFLLGKELQANGVNEEGKPKVTGIWVSAAEASQAVGHDLTVVTQRSGSGASVHTLEKVGGKYIGFAKNMSPTWAVSNETLANTVGRLSPPNKV